MDPPPPKRPTAGLHPAVAAGSEHPTTPPADPARLAALRVLERLRRGTSAGTYARDLAAVEAILRELLGSSDDEQGR